VSLRYQAALTASASLAPARILKPSRLRLTPSAAAGWMHAPTPLELKDAGA